MEQGIRLKKGGDKPKTTGASLSFLLLALIGHFLVMVDCSIAKPVISSIFLTHFSAHHLPYTWLVTIPLNFFVVIAYNRWIDRLGSFRLFLIFATITAGLHLLAGRCVAEVGILSLILSIWKDVYIMLMFHMLWSVIHAVVHIKQATYLYGLFFVVGTVGALFGDGLAGYYSLSLGSENLLFLTLPLYVLLGGVYFAMIKAGRLQRPSRLVGLKKEQGKWSDFRLIGASRLLQLILCAVVFMQVSTNIFDYQFKIILKERIVDQDLRTAFLGKLFLFVNSAGFLLQGVGGFILVRMVGLRRSQCVLPLTLLFNVVGCLLAPGFFMITAAFGAVKAIDYSVFNLLKEMLYVPLSREEKFKGRALIDVFAYRSSKAVASLIILALPPLFGRSQGGLVLVACLYVLWFIAAYAVTRPRIWEARAQKQPT